MNNRYIKQSFIVFNDRGFKYCKDYPNAVSKFVEQCKQLNQYNNKPHWSYCINREIVEKYGFSVENELVKILKKEIRKEINNMRWR